MRNVAVAAILAAALLLALFAARRWTGVEGYDPYYIDYDRPGADVTSEGP